MKDNLPEEKLLKLIRRQRIEGERAAEKAGTGTKKKFEGKFFLGVVNAALFLCATGLLGYLGYRSFFKTDETKAAIEAVTASAEAAPAPPMPETAPPPLEVYQAQFNKRDLFERPLEQVAVNASVDLTKRYKLVGIVLGEKPEAIVEDLTSRNTLFIHEGEMLDAVQVKKIEEGHVILLQEGLEVELKQ